MNRVQAEIAAQLAAVKEGAPITETADRPPSPFVPGDKPHVVDGVVIPSKSALDTFGRLAVYSPAAAVKTVRATRRGVGMYVTSGQWCLLWVGDDPDERDNVLHEFLAELADFTRRKR